MWPLEIENLSELINSAVKVEIDNGQQLEGNCVAIDPVTNSVVLHMVERNEVTIINGLNIADVVVLAKANQTGSTNPLLQKGDFAALSTEELERRKQETSDWLKSHRISVKETADGQLEVLNGTVIIQPPYGFNDCLCPNEMILAKVRAVLQKKLSRQ